jgi:hypothetical protein
MLILSGVVWDRKAAVVAASVLWVMPLIGVESSELLAEGNFQGPRDTRRFFPERA